MFINLIQSQKKNLLNWNYLAITSQVLKIGLYLCDNICGWIGLHVYCERHHHKQYQEKLFE